VRGHALGKPSGHNLGDLIDAGGAELRDTSEIPEQFLSRARADAGNVFQPCLNRAFRAALPMKTHGEAVRFIADLLDEMKDRGVMFQPDGLILLAEDKNNLFLFGNAGDGLIDDFEFFERRCGRMKLADSAIDQDQPRKRFLLFL
jgi:hypothetical protein